MSNYFVCIEGPMGGVQIVFVAANLADCVTFIKKQVAVGDICLEEFDVYSKVKIYW